VLGLQNSVRVTPANFLSDTTPPRRRVAHRHPICPWFCIRFLRRAPLCIERSSAKQSLNLAIFGASRSGNAVHRNLWPFRIAKQTGNRPSIHRARTNCSFSPSQDSISVRYSASVGMFVSITSLQNSITDCRLVEWPCSLDLLSLTSRSMGGARPRRLRIDHTVWPRVALRRKVGTSAFLRFQRSSKETRNREQFQELIRRRSSFPKHEHDRAPINVDKRYRIPAIDIRLIIRLWMRADAELIGDKPPSCRHDDGDQQPSWVAWIRFRPGYERSFHRRRRTRLSIPLPPISETVFSMRFYPLSICGIRAETLVALANSRVVLGASRSETEHQSAATIFRINLPASAHITNPNVNGQRP